MKRMIIGVVSGAAALLVGLWLLGRNDRARSRWLTPAELQSVRDEWSRRFRGPSMGRTMDAEVGEVLDEIGWPPEWRERGDRA